MVDQAIDRPPPVPAILQPPFPDLASASAVVPEPEKRFWMPRVEWLAWAVLRQVIMEESFGTVRVILVAIDFAEASMQAVRHATNLAERFGARVVLLHVLDDAGRDPVNDLLAKRRSAAVEALEPYVDTLRGQGVSATVRIEAGIPFLEVLRAARDECADLIVMGTHGRSGVTRLVLGSVAEQVLRQAPCPVFTVRAGEDPAVRLAQVVQG